MSHVWRLANGRTLTLDRPRIIAIINRTPDSFSDGGALDTLDAAIEHCQSCLAAGADALDIGGESTRPGAAPIAPEEQCQRVIPLIERLRATGIDAPISIDTTSALVARAALDAGADAINDVSGALDDPAMLALAASSAAGLILMHRLRPPAHDRYSHQYSEAPQYHASGAEDSDGKAVVCVVAEFLAERAAAALAAGVQRDAIVLDPGLGFGKSVNQNFLLIRETARLLAIGFPLLSAASRKSFVGAASGVKVPAERISGSVAISVAHYLSGVRLFRVHDVAQHAQALRVGRQLIARVAPDVPGVAHPKPANPPA